MKSIIPLLLSAALLPTLSGGQSASDFQDKDAIVKEMEALLVQPGQLELYSLEPYQLKGQEGIALS